MYYSKAIDIFKQCFGSDFGYYRVNDTAVQGKSHGFSFLIPVELIRLKSSAEYHNIRDKLRFT